MGDNLMIKRFASIFLACVFILTVISAAFTFPIKIVANAETVNEGTIEFSSENDVAKMWSYNAESKPELTTDDDVTVLKTTIKKWGQARISLPIQLQAGKTYSYSIKYRFSDSSIGGQYIRLFVGGTGQYVGDPNDAENKLDDALTNGSGATTYIQYDGEFSVKAEQLTEEQNLLSLYLKNDAESNQTYYIDSITVTLIGDTGVVPETVIMEEGTVEFDTKSDILNAFCYGGKKATTTKDGDKGVLSIISEGDPEKRVILPIKLQPKKEYSFSIKYRVDKAPVADKTTKLFLYSCKNDNYCGYGSNKPLEKPIEWGSVNNTEYGELKGTFETVEGIVNDEYTYLGIVLTSYTEQTFYIDSVTVKILGNAEEVPETVFIDEGTVDFNTKADIVNAFCSGGTKAKTTKDGDKGVLSIISEGDPEKRVTLPIRLQPKKEYSFTIKYRVDKAPVKDKTTKLYLYSCRDNSYSQYNTEPLVKILPWTSVDNTEYAEFTGTFETVNGIVDDDFEYLGIVLTSYTEQTFYIDSVTVKIIGDAEDVPETVIIEKGRVDFTTRADIISSFCSGGTEPKIDKKTGELYFKGETDKQKRVVIPVLLKPGRTYSYRIKYRVTAPADGSSFNLFSASTQVHGGYKTEFRLQRHVENTAFLNAGYGEGELVGNFKTDETNVTDVNYMLGFVFKTTTGQDFYIDYIEIDYEKTEKYPVINNFGTLDFNSYNQVELVNAIGGAGAGIIKDGDKKVLAIVANGGTTIRLPVKVENGKKIAYTIKMKVVSNNESTWFRGGNFLRFFMSDGKINDISKLTFSEKTNEHLLNHVYNYTKLAVTDDYEIVRGRVGIPKHASDDMNYLTLRFKGDATIYIDEITFRDYSNESYGNAIHSPTWELPNEPNADFTLWRSWLTTSKREKVASDSNNTDGQNIEKESNDDFKYSIILVIGVVIVATGVTILIVFIIKRRSKKKI